MRSHHKGLASFLLVVGLLLPVQGWAAVIASDNFTRSDSASLGTASDGSVWSDNTGETTTFKIASNSAEATSHGGDASATNDASGGSWPDNQYGKITFGSSISSTGVGAGYGPTCRETTGSTKTYYRLVGNGSGYELIIKNSGTARSIKSGSGTTFASSDTLTLECTTSGSDMAWVAKKNGVQFDSGTHVTGTPAGSTVITSGRVGIGHSSTTNAPNNVSAWEGGSLGTTCRGALLLLGVGGC